MMMCFCFVVKAGIAERSMTLFQGCCALDSMLYCILHCDTLAGNDGVWKDIRIRHEHEVARLLEL